MCKASQYAERTRNGVEGESLRITTGTYGIGAFHEEGVDPEACIVCVKTGTAMTLCGIPEFLQERLGIRGIVLVRFIQTPESNAWAIDDAFKLSDYPTLPSVPVSIFADQRISVRVNLVPEDDIDPQDILGNEEMPQVSTLEPAEAILDRINAGRFSLAA